MRPNHTAILPSDMFTKLEHYLMASVSSRIHGIPQHELEISARNSGHSRKSVRASVKQLIERGLIEYTDIHGRPCLTLSFQHPVQISPRLVLAPIGCSQIFSPESVVLYLERVSSFGSGKHPTTRICLEAIDWTAASLSPLQSYPFLDIGTGTGILSLAAAKLGWPSGLAIDRDLSACQDARLHVSLNQLSDRVRVSDNDCYREESPFELILANLRFPTLTSLAKSLSSFLISNGLLIVSGFQSSESSRLLEIYTSNRFRCCWRKDLMGWSGAVFMKSE